MLFDDPGWLQVAERLLREALGRPGVLRDPRSLAGRPHVVRCEAEGFGLGGLTGVVVKAPRDDGSRGSFWSDWAAAEVLSRAAEPVSARFLAGDEERQFFILEELQGLSLADLLLGDSPAEARAGVVAYGWALASLHNGGDDVAGAFRGRRATLGPSAVTGWDVEARFSARRPAFEALLERAGLMSVAAAGELDGIERSLREPGPWRGLIHGDPCPDNTRLSERLRLFDFEGTRPGHILLDATYLMVPFPTCWCVADLPEDLAEEALAAYRSRLAESLPVAGNDTSWERELLAMWAVWLVVTTVGLLDGAVKENEQWGTSSNRARIVTRLRRFADRSGASALGNAATGLATLLRGLWPDDELALPSYPALPTGAPTTASPPDWWFPGA